ncbi:MAG: 8-amino-7-oxononanoate synthase [Halothiobacillaceae bacterium]|jgi:8-amino-7-oxononanoate synthase|nr:8-amino-7-oxononanoate synthase [Halothiobacillaceae bacterium]
MRALQTELDELRQRGLYRQPRISDSPQGPVQTVDGQTLISFCSNDYLGLAADPRVVAAARRGLERYGVGSGAAHLVNGHTRAHAELEEALAEHTGQERALLFSTGYMANLGLITALTGRGDSVYQDRLNHASLLDGARLSGARLRRYAHADITHLRRQLEASTPESSGEKLIATDGVFSMDGDLAPLPALAELAREHGAWLVVDDAHGLGVLGAQGGGSLEHFGLPPDAIGALVGTLGKALGTAGAFVAGRAELIDYLIQRARPYIYTTAQPPALALATRQSLALAREEHWRREQLTRLIQRFHAALPALGLPVPTSRTPIQPLIVGDSAQALRLSESLRRRGLLVPAIRPPTVPEGSARLRITFSALHTTEQLDLLLQVLGEVLGEAPMSND